jgi:hypothetical protein
LGSILDIFIALQADIRPPAPSDIACAGADECKPLQLVAELRRLIADDRYPLSRRIRTLQGILDKLVPPPVREPSPPRAKPLPVHGSSCGAAIAGIRLSRPAKSRPEVGTVPAGGDRTSGQSRKSADGMRKRGLCHAEYQRPGTGSA